MKAFLRRLPSVIFYSGCSILILLVVCFAGVWVSAYRSQAGIPPEEVRKQFIDFRENDRHSILMGLGLDLDLDPARLTEDIVLKKGDTSIIVKSSVDPTLQNFILRLLQRSRTIQAAVVVLDSNDGRILALASYEKDGKSDNLCLKADFPAASLFKIVSAAAALDSVGFNPDKQVYYRGKRHTLYKSQLKNKIGRYTIKTSFRKAFASSINPVFGKLGIFELGQDLLVGYADKFLFNHIIPFDFPVEMSTICVPEDEFGLAEIASGFNKKTLISPLHAALLASVAVNDGVMVAPWLVENVKNESGDLLYQWAPTMLTSPISSRAAKDLKTLMEDTVRYGTCWKSFHRLRRKRAFRNVEFGAKTGTINDAKDRFKYEWLTAYAHPKSGDKAICIAALTVHGKILGTRAHELGRCIIDYYLSCKGRGKK